MDTFALDLLILCLQVKLWLILLVGFLLMILLYIYIYTIIWNILSISESNSIEIMDKTNLTDQAKFKLNEISKI